MKTNRLEEVMRVDWVGPGSYRVSILRRGERIRYVSNDSLAWFRLGQDGDLPRRAYGIDGLTYKQALMRFYRGAFAPMYRY